MLSATQAEALKFLRDAGYQALTRFNPGQVFKGRGHLWRCLQAQNGRLLDTNPDGMRLWPAAFVELEEWIRRNP